MLVEQLGPVWPDYQTGTHKALAERLLQAFVELRDWSGHFVEFQPQSPWGRVLIFSAHER